MYWENELASWEASRVLYMAGISALEHSSNGSQTPLCNYQLLISWPWFFSCILFLFLGDKRSHWDLTLQRIHHNPEELLPQVLLTLLLLPKHSNVSFSLWKDHSKDSFAKKMSLGNILIPDWLKKSFPQIVLPNPFISMTYKKRLLFHTVSHKVKI